MKDRDILIGLFNAFGSYVQRQTGETFILCIKDDEGNIHHVHPETAVVTWFNAQGEVVPPHADPMGDADRHCSLHEELNGSEKAPPPTVVQMANPFR